MACKRLAVPLLLLLSACSVVKENRDLCPCLLEIRIHGIPGGPVEDGEVMAGVPAEDGVPVEDSEVMAGVLVEDGEFRWSATVQGDTIVTVEVPPGYASITVWSGSGVPAEGGFLSDAGKEFPPLFLCHCRVKAVGESVTVNARPLKQYCTLRLLVEGPPGWGEPFRTRIRGAVRGISTSGIPVPGEFRFTPPDFISPAPSVSPPTAGSPASDGSPVTGSSPATAGSPFFSVRIPRQYASDPLLLDILMADSMVRTFSLGSILEQSGYDWSAPDLPDLDLNLSLSVTSLTLNPPAWQPQVSLSIDI